MSSLVTIATRSPQDVLKLSEDPVIGKCGILAIPRGHIVYITAQSQITSNLPNAPLGGSTTTCSLCTVRDQMCSTHHTVHDANSTSLSGLQDHPEKLTPALKQIMTYFLVSRPTNRLMSLLTLSPFSLGLHQGYISRAVQQL